METSFGVLWSCSFCMCANFIFEQVQNEILFQKKTTGVLDETERI